MTDSFIQLPADDAGKKLRTRERVIGGNTVHEQFTVSGALPTYYFLSPVAAGAANRIWMDIFNASGSGVVMRVRKLFVVSAMTAVTGAPSTFQLERTSAVGTGGTAITVLKADTSDANLPAQVTARIAPTGGATSVAPIFFPWGVHSEETAAPAPMTSFFNMIPESLEVKEPTMNEGEGIKVVQPTAGAGSWSVLAVCTVEV